MFVWWPTKCDISNHIIFFRYGYRLRVLEYANVYGINFWKIVWVTSEEFLAAKLKDEQWTRYEDW